MVRLVKAIWRGYTRLFTGWARVALAALLGVVLGVGGFTVYYSGVIDYLGDDPATCANCHAMDDHYEAWQRSSHHDVTTCNSCHLPHDNVVHKYLNKADNGFWHALKFTFQNYPENMQIREHNREITEAACLYCHGDFVDQATNSSTHKDETVSCIRCHDGVGHMR
ncbi:cytochrome c nitrite reductase small subunit [Actinomyces qiguomingii]|uniref:cytochrome c nitrite reductase small subunit n=1 Tax=Actinomyces qiguomingii TaxID=2057800 RepID=UPI000CA03AF0|nr:cytochrome c nitrite reductase small subunit [Actinomyces qiguomingii]